MTTYVSKVVLRDNHTLEEYIKWWTAASKLIQQEPGARGTKLYRMNDRAIYYGIETWDTREAREAMLQKLFRSESRGVDDDLQLLLLDRHECIAHIQELGYDTLVSRSNLVLIAEVNPE